MAKKAIDGIDNIKSNFLGNGPEFDEGKVKVNGVIEDEFRKIFNKTPFGEVRREVLLLDTREPHAN